MLIFQTNSKQNRTTIFQTSLNFWYKKTSRQQAEGLLRFRADRGTADQEGRDDRAAEFPFFRFLFSL